MVKLSDEQIISVVYASDSVLPDVFIPTVEVIHERLEHQQLESVVEAIGGKVSGEHVSHTAGELIDKNQFEMTGDNKYD